MNKILLISLLLILCLATTALAQDVTTADDVADDTAAAEGESSEDTVTAAEQDVATEESKESTETDDVVIDEETEKEIKIMQGKGAAMRILQLRRAILQQVITGKEIINYLSEKDESVPELAAINDELVILEGEATSLGVDTDLVKSFVNIKRDAHQLTNEFRTAVKPLVTGNDRKELGDRIRIAMESSTDLSDLKKEIEALRNQVNRERVQHVSTKLGISDPALLERLQTEAITKEEVRKALKKRFDALSHEKIRAARAKIKAAHDEEKTKYMLLKEEMKVKQLGVRKERLQKRWLKLSPENRLFAKKRFDEKFATLDRAALIKAKMQNVRADAKMMKEQVKELRGVRKEQKERVQALREERKQYNQEDKIKADSNEDQTTGEENQNEVEE